MRSGARSLSWPRGSWLRGIVKPSAADGSPAWAGLEEAAAGPAHAAGRGRRGRRGPRYRVDQSARCRLRRPCVPGASPRGRTGRRLPWLSSRVRGGSRVRVRGGSRRGEREPQAGVVRGGGPDRGVLDGPHLRLVPEIVVVHVAGRLQRSGHLARDAVGGAGMREGHGVGIDERPRITARPAGGALIRMGVGARIRDGIRVGRGHRRSFGHRQRGSWARRTGHRACLGGRRGGGAGGGHRQVHGHAAREQHARCRRKPERRARGRLPEEHPLGVGGDRVLSPGNQPGAVYPGGRRRVDDRGVHPATADQMPASVGGGDQQREVGKAVEADPEEAGQQRVRHGRPLVPLPDLGDRRAVGRRVDEQPAPLADDRGPVAGHVADVTHRPAAGRAESSRRRPPCRRRRPRRRRSR